MNDPIEIHTGGACLDNPGPGGYAAVIVIGQERHQALGGNHSTTSNRMEITAAIEGLKLLDSMGIEADVPVKIYSDSEYLINAFNHGWLPNWRSNGWRTAKGRSVLNQDLWLEILETAATRQVEFQWVRDQSGDPMSTLCSQLANEQANLAAQPENLEPGEAGEAPGAPEPAPKPAEGPTAKPAETGAQPSGWPRYLDLLRQQAENATEDVADRIDIERDTASILALAQARAALYQGAATHYLALTQAEEQNSPSR